MFKYFSFSVGNSTFMFYSELVCLMQHFKFVKNNLSENRVWVLDILEFTLYFLQVLMLIIVLAKLIFLMHIMVLYGQLYVAVFLLCSAFKFVLTA